MKVILLQDVKSLGKKGDLVNVSDGYARNFILPKNLGLEANSTNMNNLKLQKQKEDRKAAQELADAKELAEKRISEYTSQPDADDKQMAIAEYKLKRALNRIETSKYR